jgi:glucose/arabinose dehydrogenase
VAVVIHTAREGNMQKTSTTRSGLQLAVGLLLLALLAGPAGAVTIQLEPVVTGLTSPVGIAHAPGDARHFIVQQSGQIVIVDGTQILATPFLNISGLIDPNGGERGLLGLAFHPQYVTNGLFFVFYTEPNGSIVIARYQRMNANQANPASAQVLLRIAHPRTNHNGGQLAFGPDGFLYAAIGDGGGGGDPDRAGQNLGTLLGKILRIDVNTSPYAIPTDNPFRTTAGARGEIWVYGLRNPWRFTFDKATGDLFIGDVGQGAREEIDFQAAASPGGENYGWSCMEGSATLNLDQCGPGPRVLPILEYTHGAGDCSVTGGYRYRGSRFPDLAGVYFFADFCTGKIWGATQGGGVWSSTLLLDTTLNISSFSEDAAGEIYLADLNGGLYRIVGVSTLQVTSLTANLPSPQPVGTPITWTATVTGGSGNYQYRFWRRTTGAYMIVQDYGPSATYTFTPGPGDVGPQQVALWVRNLGSTASSEAGAIAAPFTITAGAAPAPIQVTGLTANRPSPQPVGTPITWTATATGGSGNYQFRFWRRTTGAYMIVQDYSSNAAYTFTPGPGDVGPQQVALWVRNLGSTASSEAGAIAAPFTITAGAAPAPIQVTSITANRTSPTPVGTPITWTATVTGGSGNYQYRFWRRTTGAYMIVQNYGSSATFTFTPGPGDVGPQQVAVWVRNLGSTAEVEAGGIAMPITVGPGP